MKIALIIASALLIVGMIIGTIGLASNGFNFKEMDTMKYTQNTYSVSESFSHVAVDSSIAKIEVFPATDGVCRVECEETEKIHFNVSVQNDTLFVRMQNDMKWYERFVLGNYNVSAKVYLPVMTYASLHIENKTGSTTVASGLTFGNAELKNKTGSLRFSGNVENALSLEVSTGSLKLENVTVGGDLTIEGSTGSISIANVTVANKLSLETGTGSTKIDTVTCTTFDATYDTGSFTLIDVVASEHIDIEGSTGSLRFTRMDAPHIELETSTGGVKGTLRSEKIVYAKSSTGSIDVPHGTTGGTCEVETSTGNIKIAFE